MPPKGGLPVRARCSVSVFEYKYNTTHHRFAPPAPLGMRSTTVRGLFIRTTITAAPHATCEEDEYCGYYIPKDTTVIPNVWLVSELHEAGVC